MCSTNSETPGSFDAANWSKAKVRFIKFFYVNDTEQSIIVRPKRNLGMSIKKRKGHYGLDQFCSFNVCMLYIPFSAFDEIVPLANSHSIIAMSSPYHLPVQRDPYDKRLYSTTASSTYRVRRSLSALENMLLSVDVHSIVNRNVFKIECVLYSTHQNSVK